MYIIVKQNGKKKLTKLSAAVLLITKAILYMYMHNKNNVQ